MQAVEALNKYLSDRFTGKGYEYKDANGVTQTGYDASPYNTKNQLDTTKSQAQFEREADDAKAHVSDLVQSGVPNPYAVGAILVLKRNLKKILADVKETVRSLLWNKTLDLWLLPNKLTVQQPMRRLSSLSSTLFITLTLILLTLTKVV